MCLFVVFIIIYADIAKLFCWVVIALFILFIIIVLVIFGGLGYKRRWILPRKFNASLAAAMPSMACDWIPAIIGISWPDR